MVRFVAIASVATAVVSALRTHHYGKPLADAISIMRAEMCAHQAEDSGEYPDCLKFMTTCCNPGPDGKIDGSAGEISTGEGFCADFFNRGAAGAVAAGAAPGAAPAAAAAAAPSGAGHSGKLGHKDVVAFDISAAGSPAVVGMYVIHGVHDGFTRYVQAGGQHEVIHVAGFWMIHRIGSHKVCYAVKSDKRTPPQDMWEGGPDSDCGEHPMPRLAMRSGAGRPTVGDTVTVVRCQMQDENHCSYVGRTGVITHDFHDEQPFQIASLGGEYFSEGEVVMGQRRACRSFDGTWLNEMDSKARDETVAEDALDDTDFRVSIDCKTCFMTLNGYKLTGQLSEGGLYIVWNNGFSWTRHVDGEIFPRVVNMTFADIVLQGPLPYGFDDLLAHAVSAAVRGVRPQDVKVLSRKRWELENTGHGVRAAGKIVVRFSAPAEAMMDIHKQTADMHSKLASGVLRKYLVDRSKYHHVNTINAEFSAH